MELAELVAKIASQGLLGVMLILVGLFAIKKDNELKLEREARVVDAKNYTDLALNLQKQVLEAIDKLSEILDELKKPQQRRGFGGE